MKKGKSYKFQNIIFDLDGTLIDSSRGVLSSLDQICLENNIEIERPILKKIIGPPLRETLLRLTKIDDERSIDHLLNCFKLEYDSNGYKDTIVFEGINRMLSSLYDNGINLYIATNKRKNPTNKIINMLTWCKFFKGIYSIDSFNHVKTKGDLLSHIVEKFNLKNCIYVGDHMDDLHAAKAASLQCIMVGWGFGDFTNKFHDQVIKHPYDLANKLNV